MDKPTALGSQPIQHIYRRRGDSIVRPLVCAESDSELVRVPSIADKVCVTDIMTRDVICARHDLEASLVAKLMAKNRIGCVPVVEEPGRPVGMITKQDVVEHLVNHGDVADLSSCTANELMMPLAITLGPRATVAHAAALMASEDVHHLPIVDTAGRLIGIISSMDVVRWLARNDGFGL